MERFNALGRGTQMMLVGGVLLFIDLFLPWQDFDVGGLADEFGVDATFSGWRGVGVILGLLTIVLLAWVIVRLAVGRHPAAGLDGDDGRVDRDADPDLRSHQDADHPR